MTAYRVVMWKEEDGVYSEPQTAVFENEEDAQIYEQIWREQGHIVRVCGSEQDYEYPLYNMNNNSKYLVRRSSRPFTDDPARKGELVFHKVICGNFGVIDDTSEYGFAGVVCQNGNYIPFDDIKEINEDDALQWEETISRYGEWF